MGLSVGNEVYFQRGPLFWFTIITLSFGYYTVKAAKGARAPFNARSGPARTGCAGATLPKESYQSHLEPFLTNSGTPPFAHILQSFRMGPGSKFQSISHSPSGPCSHPIKMKLRFADEERGTLRVESHPKAFTHFLVHFFRKHQLSQS